MTHSERPDGTPHYQAPQPQVHDAHSQVAQPQYAQPQVAQPQPAMPVGTFFVPLGPGEPFNGAAHSSDLLRPLYGASFPQAIRRFFASFVRFSGRASRSEFWWSFLFCGLLRVAPFLLLGVTAIVSEGLPASALSSSTERSLALLGGLLVIIVHLGLLLPQLAVASRRLHDSNFSGLFLLFLLIPWIGTIIVGVLMLLDSKPAGRRFDADPFPAPGTMPDSVPVWRPGPSV